MDEYLNRQRAPLRPETPPGLDGWNSDYEDWYQAESDRSGRESWGMRSASLWICIQCAAAKYHWDSDRWVCEVCGCDQLALEEPEDPDGHPEESQQGRSFAHHGRGCHGVRHGAPEPPDPYAKGSEQAESEALTTDPLVDPDEDAASSTSRRRRRRGAAQNSQHAGKGRSAPEVATGHFGPQKTAAHPLQPAERDEVLVKKLARSLKDFIRSDDADSWNSRRGPPQPPPWRYNLTDVRAFRKWKRKIEMWREQVSSYLPENESAMLLYTSLTGEAEEEIEFLEPKKINSRDGISYIMNALESSLQQKAVFSKRKLLDGYEHVQRFTSETLRSYTNRYRR